MSRIHKYIEIAGIGCLAVMAVITFMQVILRYVFNKPLPWPEELARYLLIWMTFLGTVVLVKKDLHVKVVYFSMLLPNKIRLILEIVIYIGVMTFCIFLLIGAVPLLQDLWTLKSPALKVPRPIILLSLPLCSILMVIDYIYFTIDRFKELKSLTRV